MVVTSFINLWNEIYCAVILTSQINDKVIKYGTIFYDVDVTVGSWFVKTITRFMFFIAIKLYESRWKVMKKRNKIAEGWKYERFAAEIRETL